MKGIAASPVSDSRIESAMWRLDGLRKSLCGPLGQDVVNEIRQPEERENGSYFVCAREVTT